MPELSRGRRRLILAICCMSLFIVGLDNTIVNLALPSIQRDLHASISSLQWTIDAYVLVLASLLMLAGSTADRVGRRRTFQTGLTLFGLGSLLCSVAPSAGWLIVFRMVQAVGGSMLNPVAMSIITNTFTDNRERARAIGVWGGVIGLSMALGPLVGGALVETAGWQSIFWINVPVCLAAIVLAARFVPESRSPRPRRLDPVGQLLVIALFAGLTYGIIEGPGHGWGSPEIIGCFVLAALAALGLAVYEPRRREPLLDLRFFRSVPFSGTILIAISGFAALSGYLFLNALYLQQVRGMSPLEAGLFSLPSAAITAILAPLSGRVVASRGARLPLIVAGIGLIASGLMLTQLDANWPIPLLLLPYVAFGIGFGTLNAPITNTAVSGMPRAQGGVAAAVASTSRQLGAALGVAIIGSAVTSHISGPYATGFTPASHLGWWIMTGCGGLVLAMGILTTSRWARRTADTAAATFSSEESRIAVTTP
ncbi:MFS transporter [Kutzneria sp. NPDC052558]|uniref:MFS transporter n=1 Tax=Kutzneria sp. NPDC052558 TaxID=3364121 RepID=UPI0037C96BE8